MNSYGRYVDDFVLARESREHLASLIPSERYLGAVIKPNRV